MEIKQLKISDIHINMLNYFNRYQEVTQCWEKNENNWVLEDVSYIRDWNEDKKKWAINYFLQCIEQGGMILGAFDEYKLIGFAKIDGKLFGSLNQYINLSLLLISNEYRHQGLGRRLFMTVCERAISLNAKKLYISAHSAKDAIAFYKKMGCKDAQEIIQELIDKPCDLQLEYQLCHRR